MEWGGRGGAEERPINTHSDAPSHHSRCVYRDNHRRTGTAPCLCWSQQLAATWAFAPKLKVNTTRLVKPLLPPAPLALPPTPFSPPWAFGPMTAMVLLRLQLQVTHSKMEAVWDWHSSVIFVIMWHLICNSRLLVDWHQKFSRSSLEWGHTAQQGGQDGDQ